MSLFAKKSMHKLTQSEIRELLDEEGLRPDHRYGQHFLVDGNLLELLVREADLLPTDVVLEVGAGVGNLTDRLVAEAGHVVAVEIDARLAPILERRLGEAENLDLRVCDVLADKHHVAPDVLEVARRRAEETGGRLKLVSNLPYSAATPLVAELVADDNPPSLLVFTVQEEVAARLAAEPSTRAYGPVGVLVQALAEVTVLRRLAPSVFWPRPQVYSAMVRVWPSPGRRRRIADPGTFRGIVEGLFAHRRKRAPKSLALADPDGASPETWATRLEDAGLDPQARGETYRIAEIIELANRAPWA